MPDARHDESRGRDAATPSAIPRRGWRDILWRIWRSISEDRVMLIAAGVTFYLLLALFPALASFVSLYGFFADPAAISEQIAFLEGVLPSGALDIVRSQLTSLAAQPSGTLSLGFLASFAVAFWSANNGIKSIFEALNIAYGEGEKRSFVKLNLVAFAFTLGAMIVASVMLISVGLVPALLALINLGQINELLIRLLRWPVLLLLVATGVAILYRYGPSRVRAKWRWITWGSALATIVWVTSSIAFSIYLQRFADFNATYGSLGAVIGFLFWTWISVIILLVGAELNAEIEHQTARDSTTGPDKPMGERGARVADSLGEAIE